MSPKRTSLFIVVPVFNNWKDTRECLAGLKGQTYSDFRLLVADDGSDEPAPADFFADARIECLRYPHAGFATNCNRAAEYALSRAATHLLFLNCDTLMDEGLLGGLLEQLGDEPKAAISPVIYWARKPRDVWFSGGGFSWWTAFGRRKRRYLVTTPVDILCGCCLLVTSTAWRATRGFDERFSTYYEDFDWALRARREGVRLLVAPACGIQHKVSWAGSKESWPRHYLLIRGALLFIRRHYRPPLRWALLALKLMHLVWFVGALLPRFPEARPLYAALRDGLSLKLDS